LVGFSVVKLFFFTIPEFTIPEEGLASSGFVGVNKVGTVGVVKKERLNWEKSALEEG
jgi:hypothetical protein